MTRILSYATALHTFTSCDLINSQLGPNGINKITFLQLLHCNRSPADLILTCFHLRRVNDGQTTSNCLFLAQGWRTGLHAFYVQCQVAHLAVDVDS